MKIINGKWQDVNEDPVDNFNVSELLEIGKNVQALYGEKITYDRITLMSSIRRLTSREESSLAYLLEQEGAISKLAGY
jgi:glutaminase